jgi:hypothetical protein
MTIENSPGLPQVGSGIGNRKYSMQEQAENEASRTAMSLTQGTGFEKGNVLV